MRLALSREVLGTLRNATLSLNAGKWYVSIQTEREVVQPVPTASTAIGIDMGITRFATLSDGTFVAPLNSFKKHEQRLARYQRHADRKAKFSKNWHKAKRVQLFTPESVTPAETICTRPQQRSAKPRDGLYRGFAGAQHEQKSAAGNAGQPGKNVQGQRGSEQSHSRPGLVRVSPPTGVQIQLEWRDAGGRACAQHERRLARAAGMSPKRTA